MNDTRPVIAQVLHKLYIAGAEVLAAGLARKLVDRYRFVFLCLDEIGPLGEQLAGEGFDVLHLHRQPGVDWPIAWRLGRRIKQYGVDLLHAHQYTPFFWSALSRLPRAQPPIIFTEHGRHYPDQRKVKRVLANKVLLRGGDCVIAVGQFVKQALVHNEGIADQRIEVIYNGVDPAPLDAQQAVKARVEVRDEFNLATDQPVVLQVARFHPVKDHATSIRAFAHMTSQIPNACLLLAGEGQKRSESQALAKQLGVANGVRFLGERDDVSRLMAAADLFVLSSLSEGISLTLLEAMAAQLPIAATDVGGNREVIAGGESGLLSPRGDDRALSTNLVALLDDRDRRAAMGRAGRQRLLEHFTQQQMHDQYAGLFERLIGRYSNVSASQRRSPP